MSSHATVASQTRQPFARKARSCFTEKTLNFMVHCRKVNHMVHEAILDQTFSALSDATRRSVLTRLGDGPATIGELAEPAGMTLTGMKKHVLVLENAGLVVTEKVGRSRQVRLGTERLDDAMTWISFYQRLWERRLDGLDAFFTLQKGRENE
ncbi:DNA-binding transcriptional ArsR family regulator [Okibacterium sp. HSC-33S16]|uniref:ArsR/SmtB family transcription factor n=1 Tax=Okibacterium sp. HSC-33S16 TaxID=2910965 RepID=UPI00209E72BA|nr:metalloregulator ArsR/SmtB family transcription factor [Okibacterium sp. HSC-33S16]MCP2031199.1 DNA-binding transcriptional ArsR family regulator [Okibacterium sp. HSC-33S16]